jgi:hypothetical protein
MVPIVSISAAAAATNSRPLPGLSDHLIAASGVRPADQVLVFGYNVLDHLVALARHGVGSAAGVHAGYRFRPHEGVDVVWFTSVGDIDAEVIELLGAVASARAIAVELMVPSEFGPLRRLLWRLRDGGFTNTSYCRLGSRFVLTAGRSSAREPTEAAGTIIPIDRSARGR